MSEYYTKAQVDLLATEIGKRIKEIPITEQVGGQWLLDPNEFNGWGILGTVDNTNSQDLGDVGAANLSRTAGGLKYPFDVQVTGLYLDTYNSNGNAEAFGWGIFKQSKTEDSNVVETTYILDEVADNAGVGPRNYGNTLNQKTEIDLSQVANPITVNAGEVIGLGVMAPTANNTNYYVRVMAGFIQLKRV